MHEILHHQLDASSFQSNSWGDPIRTTAPMLGWKGISLLWCWARRGYHCWTRVVPHWTALCSEASPWPQGCLSLTSLAQTQAGGNRRDPLQGSYWTHNISLRLSMGFHFRRSDSAPYLTSTVWRIPVTAVTYIWKTIMWKSSKKFGNLYSVVNYLDCSPPQIEHVY